MKKKLFIISLVLFALATIGVVIDFSNAQCSHSLDSHNCSEHLTQVRNIDDRCPTCFRTYDIYGFCPLCDYETCPICSEWTYIKDMEFCVKCDNRVPEAVCNLCGKLLRDCNCSN